MISSFQNPCPFVQSRYHDVDSDPLESKREALKVCRPENRTQLCPHCLQPCNSTKFSKEIYRLTWPKVGEKLVRLSRGPKRLSFA